MAAYRHEYKHEINKSDFITLSICLNAALKADEFARADGAYEITSLYFDDVYNTALKEKISGVNCRDKFRLRRYNNDTEHIKLEKEKQARRPMPEGERSHNRHTGAKHNRRRYRLSCRSGRRYDGAVQRRARKLQRRIHGLTAMSNSRHTTLFCGIIAALTLALTLRHFPRTRGQLLVSGNFKKAPIGSLYHVLIFSDSCCGRRGVSLPCACGGGRKAPSLSALLLPAPLSAAPRTAIRCRPLYRSHRGLIL